MRRPLLLLTGIAVAVALAACGQASGEAPSGGTASGPAAGASGDPDGATIVARELRFDQASYGAPAGRPFSLVFDNRDGAPHNVSIAKDPAFSQKVFEGEVFSGPGSRTYDVGALAAGTYAIRCDVHPDMKATLVVR